MTGRAWGTPATEIVVQILPSFGSHKEMAAYYSGALGIPTETATSISDYMTGVRAIASYAFLDSRDLFLGLLSVDFSKTDVSFQNGQLLLTSADSRIAVDANKLGLLLMAMGNILESFQQRRQSYET